MNLLLITLLCIITARTSCADTPSIRDLVQQSYHTEDTETLIPGMWGTKKITNKKEKRLQQKEDGAWPRLTKKKCLNRFWKTVKRECTQEEKDYLLKLSHCTNTAPKCYYAHRANIAAAARWCDAHIRRVQSWLSAEGSFFQIPLEHGDLPFIKLLLSAGATPNEEKHVLFRTNDLRAIQLFERYGALDKECYPDCILHHLLSAINLDNKILSFYLQNGYSALEIDNDHQRTTLELVIKAITHGIYKDSMASAHSFMEKFAILSNSLDRKDKIEQSAFCLFLLRHKSTDKKVQKLRKVNLNQLMLKIDTLPDDANLVSKTFDAFLCEQLGRECLICWDTLAEKSQLQIVPCCSIAMCARCIEQCIQCPTCRKPF